ncbi:MAG: sigma-70 family RNA polymerase sigma factor [Bacteroidetes bacterium]|nr:sigma-70 family RNA polymerase sigma factor [Bacteroidota bacterium]
MKAIEKEIIKLLHVKDRIGLELVYDNYAAAFYGIALKVVKSEALAQDVVQESMIKIWKNGDKYDEKKGTIFNWMLNIVRRTAIDKTRSPNFRPKGRIQTLDPTVYENTWRSQLNTDVVGLQDMVNNLEERYRVIIEMAYFQGYTQKEIEKELDIPIGTVKSRIRIALRELRKSFNLQIAISIILAIGIMLSSKL